MFISTDIKEKFINIVIWFVSRKEKMGKMVVAYKFLGKITD